MPDSRESLQRPSYESAKDAIRVEGPPPSPEPEGVSWDKPPPSGPPNPRKLAIPKHLNNIVRFFKGLILDESLLLDLCLEQAMELVQRNVEARMVGIDHFAGEGGGGSPYTPVNYAAIAGPLTVELYKQVLAAIGGRKEEYDRLYEEMTREREKSSPGGPRIVVP